MRGADLTVGLLRKGGGRSARDDCADIVAIQQLKARYAWFADCKYTAARRRKPHATLASAARAQAGCFTADATWDGGRQFGRKLRGRAALLRFFCGGPWSFALHHYVSPVIEVQGDRASGWWRLWQLAVPKGSDTALLLAAVTEEEYRCRDGVWLHSAVRFRQIHRVRASEPGVLGFVEDLT